MVVLSRIYTRTGDRGTTALGDARRVVKDHPRIEAVGAVDELNAAIGLALAAGLDAPGAGLDGADAALLRRIQNDLFDLGADLCVPSTRGRRGKPARPPLRITEAHVTPLEAAIDRLNESLEPLRSFVLPGGTPGSSWLHLARTVCRRAERRVVALGRKETVGPQVVIYLNRLSDLLFVMARHANQAGRGDVLWVPGGGTTTRS